MRLVVGLALCGAVTGLAACGDDSRGGGDAGTDAGADTDSDTDSDTDGDSDPECTTGDCCDVGTQSFQPSTFSCDSATEYACDGEGCGATAQQRTVTTYCSGVSTACDGGVEYGEWSTIEECIPDEPCETDGASYAECGAIDVGGCCAASGNWYDPATGLCWQNPPSPGGFTWGDAATHCSDLDLGGHDDWRSPMIQELISLIRGCVNGTATGDLSTSDCEVTDPGCLGDACFDYCASCVEFGGPDDNPEGCYWDPVLLGDCSYGYWSSSTYTWETSLGWVVYFGGSAIGYNYKDSTYYIRCVRG